MHMAEESSTTSTSDLEKQGKSMSSSNSSTLQGRSLIPRATNTQNGDDDSDHEDGAAAAELHAQAPATEPAASGDMLDLRVKERNDDDAERSSSVASERAVATSTADSPRSPRETMFSIPQEEHFQECLKLYAENKINENNAWDLKLTDIMASMMRKRDSRMDNLQTASTVVAASVRIYSSRVDALYSDVLMLAGRLSKAAQDDDSDHEDGAAAAELHAQAPATEPAASGDMLDLRVKERNDDDAERSSSVASERAVATSTPDSPRSPRETMFSIPQEEHFQECLKLYAENKINENNAWDLKLTDIMASMMRKRDSRMDNLQTASTVVAASVRIYSSRVDALYSDVLMLAGRLSKAAQDDDSDHEDGAAAAELHAQAPATEPAASGDMLDLRVKERNDDDAERSSSVASERAVATSTPDSPRSPRETMFSIPQEEHFQECLKLYAENKINENNAWDLKLTDIMASMMRKRDSRMDNLQTASTVVAASVRIYSSRVDALYSDVLMLAGRLSKAAQDDDSDHEDGAAAAELHAQAPATEPAASGDMLDLRVKERNDDDAERSSSVASERAVATSTPDSPRSPRETMFSIPQEEHFQECLKLYAENKINENNAWDLKLTDIMASMMRKRDSRMDNLQTASTVVAASVRIYSSRVDALYSDVLMLAGRLSKAAQDDDSDHEDGAAAAELHAQAPATEPAASGDMLDLRVKERNDDDAERSSSVASELAVATSTPDSPRSPRETMFSIPQEEHFQECLKLYAENKINENNAWDLKLTDIMASMMRKRDSRMDNLQTASTVVAASVRIYSSRVDALYSDVLMLAGRLSKAAQDDDSDHEDGAAAAELHAQAPATEPAASGDMLDLRVKERNDDDAERSSSVASERAVATSTPDSPRSPRETMFSIPQEEHFQECLKLYAENKINENNAWDLKLTDIMASMMRKRDSRMDNLQTASTVVAASVRIYSSRVDALYSDVLMLAGRLSKAAQDDESDHEDGAAAAELHAQAPAAEPAASGDMLDLRVKEDESDYEDGAAAAASGDLLDLRAKVAKIFIPYAMRAKKVDMTQLKRCTGKLLTDNSQEDEEE